MRFRVSTKRVEQGRILGSVDVNVALDSKKTIRQMEGIQLLTDLQEGLL